MDASVLLSRVPIDFIILFSVALLVALETFRAGSGRASVLALTFLVGYQLFLAAQSAAVIGGALQSNSSPYIGVILFALLCAGVYFCLSKIILAFDLGGGIFPAILCGVAVILFLLIIWIQVPALSNVWSFSSSIQAAFGDQFRFYWASLALALLALARM